MFLYALLFFVKLVDSKLITSNVGSSPNTSPGAYGPRDVSGEEPPFSVINSYIIILHFLIIYVCMYFLYILIYMILHLYFSFRSYLT